MAEPFLAQITYFGGNFAPRGYALCQGQILPIAQNTALFSLLGTTYGGNGQTTFALPDLRGRAPIQQGQGPGLSNIQLGQQSGAETTTLTVSNLPAHTHAATFSGTTSTFSASSTKATLQLAATGSPLGRSIDQSGNGTAQPRIYAPAGSPLDIPLSGLNVAGTVTVQPAGSNQAFSIRDPYLGLNAIIALQGIFPSRN